MDEIRFNHYLPYSDNSSYDIVLNVQLPTASIERITISIMSDDTFYQGWEETPSRPLSSWSTEQQEELAQRAGWKALDDVLEIQELSKRGVFLIVKKDELPQRARLSAQAAIKDILRGKLPTKQEYQQLIQKYQDNYLLRFEEELQDTDSIQVYTEQQIRLRKIAIKDRKNAPQHRDYHIRDLAVVRVLADIGVPAIEGEEHLSTIHELADFYQYYYSNPGEEEYWPGPNSFLPAR